MLVTIYAGFVGLMIGSAINAIVWRLHVGRSWAKGRSECPECAHQLSARDLVPVLSWLALRGKCRYCRAPIKDHPWVELATAGLFALSVARLAPTDGREWLQVGLWLPMLTLLIILAVYDLRWMLLPNKIMYPALILAVAMLLAQWPVAHGTLDIAAWRGPVLAALVFGGAFLALVWGSGGRAMGGGDIKLAALMGLILGLKATALAMLIAFNSAALVGVVLIATRRRKRRDHLPFGPFLVLGTVVAYLYGADIVQWYLRANGLS